MAITFRDVTKANWLECVRLKPRDDQKTFVAPNAFSLAESKYYPELVPLAIYADETMVGFLMWGPPDREDNNGVYWIIRLMIDERYQGKGYGRDAMQQIITQLREKPDCMAIQLSYEPENLGAEILYNSLGFHKTGEILEGELVSRLNIRG